MFKCSKFELIFSHYLCFKRKVPVFSLSSTANPGCPEHKYMIYISGMCVHLVKIPMTFDESREHCRRVYGGHLVHIHNSSQNNAVAGLAKDKDLWIGYFDYKPELKDRKKGYAWTDTRKQNPKGWANWNPGEPNGKGGHGDVRCAMIWGENTHSVVSVTGLHATWDDRGCDSKMWFVCQTSKFQVNRRLISMVI